MSILGLDLGQSQSAWETLDTQSGAVASGQVRMDDDPLRKLLARTQPDQLVIEIGPLAAHVHDLAVAAGTRVHDLAVAAGTRMHDLAVAAGTRVLVADTTQDAWRWKNVKRKTDADDAHKLVRLAALGQINPVHIPAPPVRERRHLLEYRQALVAEQTRCKNRIRATPLLHGRQLPDGKNGWSVAVRAALAAQARPLAECGPEELWRGLLRTELEHLQQVAALLATVTAQLDALAAADPRVAQLRTIRGVGARTAEVLITVLDQPRRFASRRQVAAYGGWVPRRYQSGQMDRSGRISKRGSTLLRAVLNQAAWVAVRCNPELRAFFLRVGGGHKQRRKPALVALMRKLLVIAWALLRDGTVYEARRLQAPRAQAAAGCPGGAPAGPAASFPSAGERNGWRGVAGLDGAREVEDEVVRMGNGQSGFASWDDRRVQRREQPVTENTAWSCS